MVDLWTIKNDVSILDEYGSYLKVTMYSALAYSSCILITKVGCITHSTYFLADFIYRLC